MSVEDTSSGHSSYWSSKPDGESHLIFVCEQLSHVMKPAITSVGAKVIIFISDSYFYGSMYTQEETGGICADDLM